MGKGKLVILKTYDDAWLMDWCKKELEDCARNKSISKCQNCVDYGACVNDPIRVILKRLAQREPVVVKVKPNRSSLVS